MGCLVFVSHRTRDLQTAKRMVDVLRAALHLTKREVLFTGQIALAPKADVDDTLVRELHGSKVVIGLFTRGSKGSVYQVMELGAAWFAEKLIVAVVETRDVARLPQPLAGNQAVALDDPLLVDGLIETIGTSIGRTPEPPEAYKNEMARLLFWTRRVEPLLRYTRTAALTVASGVAAMLLLSFLLSRQNIDGEVHTLDQVGARVKIKGAKVYVDSANEVETNDQGAFTFSVRNAFPKRHRVSIAPPDATGQFDTYWFGPWPLQSLSEDRVDFRYDPTQPADKRFYVAGNRDGWFSRALSAVSGVVVAAAPLGAGAAAEPAVAAAVNEVEAGFLVETVSTPKLSALAFYKSKRAFFKVWIDGKQLGDREVLAPAPLTLGKNANVFPVQSNRQSWIPVGDTPIRFANLFCRFPPGAVSSLAPPNHVIFDKDIVVQLVSGDGDMLGQFVLTRKVPYAIGQSINLADTTKMSATLRMQPVVRLKPIDLKWIPNTDRVAAGQSLTLTVSATEALPFPVEFSLTQSSTGGAAVVNLPRRATVVGREPVPLNLRFTAQSGTVKIVSHLPAVAKRLRDDDDADVVVMPSGWRRNR
jgi:hypothetical protein